MRKNSALPYACFPSLSILLCVYLGRELARREWWWGGGVIGLEGGEGVGGE